MGTSRLMSRIRAALLAVVLGIGTVWAPADAQDLCANPTFRIPEGSPFKVRPRPGVATEPTALASGTYVARSGSQPGCGCDLAVALRVGGNPPEGVVALMRGNEDGSFTLQPGALLAVDPNPVAMTSGRFRRDVPFDGIVAVTARPGQNGRAHVFVPDDRGVYRPPQTGPSAFVTGPDPAAITTGDFNGDGELDVAIANKGNGSLTVLLGTGSGTFGSTVVTVPSLGGPPGSLIPESLAAGKFSGRPAADDIAVSVLQNVGGSRRVGIVIVPGSTAAAFAPRPVIPVGQNNSFGSWLAAANLSGPRDGGTGQRRSRDLAIAFTDRTVQGVAVGRVKVLLGKDGGGLGDVAAAQSHDLGASPRSIKVADLDDDGVVDLIVSTFGDLASQNDGTIRFFQGQAAPPASVGFQRNPQWFTIPDTTGIRPRALVTGRWGRSTPGGPPASVGVAALNAPSLDSVAVFLGNGRGAFVQPSRVTTLLVPDDRLFVSGDFHSGDGQSPLLDLAFVTTVNQRNVLTVLQSNGAGGFERTRGGPPILAGNDPTLIAAGQFTGSGPTSVAIVDATGSAGQQPLLKIFLGDGDGRFRAGAELPLPNAGRPRAMATGAFRGAGMPLDVAIVGDTTPPGATSGGGRLTVLFNDGNGAFTVGRTQTLDFVPGSIAASSRLRPGGSTDLLVRDVKASRFLFLVNLGNGDFRPAINPSLGFFDGAGNVDALLVGDVSTAAPSAGLDDVVTFDQDMTLKVFVNIGNESFALRTVAPPAGQPGFAGARPPYVLADFGSGTLGLGAPVVRDGQIGLALLQGDGAGGFTVTTGQVPLLAVRGTRLRASGQTDFAHSLPPSSRRADLQLIQGMAAQFRSALHGNGKPDIAFIVVATERSVTAGMCADDPRPVPPPERPPAPVICREQLANEECPIGQRPCFVGDCCFCTTGHPRRQCPSSCSVPLPPPIPFQALCRTAQLFAPTLTVYGNTCGD